MGKQQSTRRPCPREQSAYLLGGLLLASQREAKQAQADREIWLHDLLARTPEDLPVSPDVEPPELPARYIRDPDPGLRPSAPEPEGADLERQVLNLLRLHDWDKPLNPYKPPRRHGPRKSRERFLCPPGCMAAREASRLDDLKWEYFVTLSAAPFMFWDLWQRWDGLGRLDRQFGDRCFWVRAFAQQPGSSQPHAHILIGGATDRAVLRLVDRWMRLGGNAKVQAVTNRAGGRWGILHYLHAPTVVPYGPQGKPRKGTPEYNAHIRDVKLTHAQDVYSYCPALLVPPHASDNVDVLVEIAAYRIAKTRGERSASSLSPSARTERARKAARARWDRNPVKPKRLT